MTVHETSELDRVIETFDLVVGTEPERYESTEKTPNPEQLQHYFRKLEEIARARQAAEQRSGELFLR